MYIYVYNTLMLFFFPNIFYWSFYHFKNVENFHFVRYIFEIFIIIMFSTYIIIICIHNFSVTVMNIRDNIMFKLKTKHILFRNRILVFDFTYYI